MGRLLTFDIAKAICIILVVVGHYYPDNSPGWYKNIHDIIYSFHMPLFMFASGYIYMFTWKEQPYSRFLLKKVKRLLIPYLSASILIITLKLASQHGNALVENPVTWMSYIRMFYYPEAGFFLWFIIALWWMFVLVPLFRTKKQRLVLFMLAIILHYLPIEATSILCLQQVKTMLVFFMLGVVIADYSKVRGLIIRINGAIGLALFCAVETIMLAYPGTMAGKIAETAAPYLGICATIYISNIIATAKSGLTKLLTTISGSLYIVYLFIPPLRDWQKQSWIKFRISTDMTQPLLSSDVSLS